MRFKRSFKLGSWCIVALSLNAIWAQIGSNIPLGRLLLGALDRLGTILEAFWPDFHSKMEPRWHLNLPNPWSYAKTARKLKNLSPGWLENSSWALLGRLLVGALGRLGSILEAFWPDFHAKMERRWHLNPINPSSYVKTARKLWNYYFSNIIW